MGPQQFYSSIIFDVYFLQGIPTSFIYCSLFCKIFANLTSVITRLLVFRWSTFHSVAMDHSVTKTHERKLFKTLLPSYMSVWCFCLMFISFLCTQVIVLTNGSQYKYFRHTSFLFQSKAQHMQVIIPVCILTSLLSLGISGEAPSFLW